MKIGDRIYLAQTDTTAGFLSRDPKKLNKIKGRDPRKKLIRAVSDLGVLKQFARAPAKYKNIIRRSKKTTFIFSNSEAIRVIYGDHAVFLRDLEWMFSTSANKSGEKFDLKYAVETADIIAYDKRGFFESEPSKIYKISRRKIKKIR